MNTMWGKHSIPFTFCLKTRALHWDWDPERFNFNNHHHQKIWGGVFLTKAQFVKLPGPQWFKSGYFVYVLEKVFFFRCFQERTGKNNNEWTLGHTHSGF